jgi:hypothetical protein
MFNLHVKTNINWINGDPSQAQRKTETLNKDVLVKTLWFWYKLYL